MDGKLGLLDRKVEVEGYAEEGSDGDGTFREKHDGMDDKEVNQHIVILGEEKMG